MCADVINQPVKQRLQDVGNNLNQYSMQLYWQGLVDDSDLELKIFFNESIFNLSLY